MKTLFLRDLLLIANVLAMLAALVFAFVGTFMPAIPDPVIPWFVDLAAPAMLTLWLVVAGRTFDGGHPSRALAMLAVPPSLVIALVTHGWRGV